MVSIRSSTSCAILTSGAFPLGSKLGTTDQRDYYQRAYALAAGDGHARLSRAEANYWTTFTDAHGNRLMGTKRYVLRLSPGGIPSNAFWSMTLDQVEKDGQFLALNPINRYRISSTSPNLTVNPDGSIDIWIQPAALSADEMANWLPSPATGLPFLLFARSYEPKPEVLKGDPKMPAVEMLS